MQEVKLQLRLDAALHQRLVASAKKNHRSLNAELVSRLSDSFEAHSPSKAEILALVNAAIDERLQRQRP